MQRTLLSNQIKFISSRPKYKITQTKTIQLVRYRKILKRHRYLPVCTSILFYCRYLSCVITEHHSRVKSDDRDADAISSASEHSSRSSSRQSSHSEDSDDDRDGYLSASPVPSPVELKPQLPPYFPALQGCRNVEEFQCLNRIEEGTYGVVYRAVDRKTGL